MTLGLSGGMGESTAKWRDENGGNDRLDKTSQI